MSNASRFPFATKTLGLAVAALLTASAVHAQSLPANYPSKPIELNIPFAPGGGVDLFGRTVARLLYEEKIVPQPIQVNNAPGAGGARGIAEMVKRKGDPYSLLGIAIHIIVTPLTLGTPHTYKDVTPIAKLFSEYEMLVVRADSPIKSLKEIEAAFKKDPGALKIGGASLGSADHMTVSRFAQSFGVDPAKLTYIAYSGGESNAAILGGHVDIGLGGLDLIDLIESGKMRVLAISSKERLGGDFAKIPTFTEQGYDVVNQNWRGIFAPPGISPDEVRYWRNALRKMTQSEAWKKELETRQWVASYEDETFADSIAKETIMYTDLLTKLNLVKKN